MRCLIAALTLIPTAFAAHRADACCLTDWLFGRTTPHAVGCAPYAVGYTPYAAGYAPYAVGYAPYAVGYAPSAAVPGYATNGAYQANLPAAEPWVAPATTLSPAAPPTTTSVLSPNWGGTLPLSSSGVYQTQRPALSYDNPSVYTGLPATAPVPAAPAPVVSAYRGNAAASSYLGAANTYPSTYAAAQVPIAPGLPQPVGTPTGAPVTALPATPVAPLFPPTPPQPSGLSRFFGSMFGTNYRTSYYRAPVTYYRPATTVDPVSGTTVTVQRPCTSYVQQVQRTPYSSLQVPQHTAAPTYIQPATECAPTAYGNAYGAPNGLSSSPSPIGQVGATALPDSGSLTVPIPSTGPPTAPTMAPPTTGVPSYDGSSGYGPNAAPLTGPPPSAVTRPRGSGDAAPVDQPTLRNRQPADTNGDRRESEETREPADSPPKSYWELQNAEDSTAMIRSTRGAGMVAQPIPAPDGFVSPSESRLNRPSPLHTPKPADGGERSFEAPPLPPRSLDAVDRGPESNWVTAPVREASAIGRRPADRTPAHPEPQPIPRDTTWTAARR